MQYRCRLGTAILQYRSCGVALLQVRMQLFRNDYWLLLLRIEFSGMGNGRTSALVSRMSTQYMAHGTPQAEVQFFHVT
jgi:hypothetical protein